jgi:hypothetical protein
MKIIQKIRSGISSNVVSFKEMERAYMYRINGTKLLLNIEPVFFTGG